VRRCPVIGRAPGISGMPLMKGMSVAVENWEVVSFERGEAGGRVLHSRGHKERVL
jgi:hypothetical protein